MRRMLETTTHLTTIAASLATMALVLWMTSFAAPPDSIFSAAVQERASPAHLYAAAAPHRSKVGGRRLS